MISDTISVYYDGVFVDVTFDYTPAVYGIDFYDPSTLHIVGCNVPTDIVDLNDTDTLEAIKELVLKQMDN